MRVVFLTPEFPRRSGDQVGAALLVLARALARRGVALRVVTLGDGDPGETELDGVSVRRIHLPSAGRADDRRTGWVSGTAAQRPPPRHHLLRAWRGLARATRQALTERADLVHAHSWIPAGIAAPSSVPLVLSFQSTDARLLGRSRLARALARRLLQRTALVTTTSREIATWVESATGRHIGPSHIQGLPLETRGLSWTRGGGGALTIAPLQPEARVGLALETIAVLASMGHHIPLTIIGAGPDRDQLEQRAAGLGIATLVRFAGDLSREEAARYLDRADILLFTAKSDGVAGAALQALVSGIPAVACWDSGAAVEIVPASGPGRLTLPDPQALADAMLALQGDPDRLAMARLVGESWRARLSPDHVAEICEGWYREALAPAVGAAPI